MPKQTPAAAHATRAGSIAYVLKGYPRLSETFIASEMYRLEQQGVPLRLFVIKPADENIRQPIVERIQVTPEYLPDAGSVSDIPFPQWLKTYGVRFFPALRRILALRLAGVVRAAAFAVAQAVRARRSLWVWPRKVYAKEFFQAVALADRLLATPNVRHLHAHFCHGATTVTWMASMMTGLPFSFTAHAKDIYSASLNPAGLLHRKLLAARFAVTCTEANREHLRAIAPTANVYRIYHGVNVDFTQLVKEHHAENDSVVDTPLRLLAVGRLVEKKGFDTFVEACGLLHQQNIRFSAVIAGENGEHGDIVRRRVEALGLTSRVTFLGPLRQDQLFREYRRASLFCLPCRVLDDGDRDGIPNVLMEAMACAVPVIATTISGIPELITDSVNGLLIPPEDPVALAAAMLRLHRDPWLARRLANAGQATIHEHFDGDILARQLVQLFRHGVTGKPYRGADPQALRRSEEPMQPTSVLPRHLS
jgi:glycosyltransferase involved in cell wall biosynthesis